MALPKRKHFKTKEKISEDLRKVLFSLAVHKMCMQKCVQQNTALFAFVYTFGPGIWVLNGHCTSFIKIKHL